MCHKYRNSFDMECVIESERMIIVVDELQIKAHAEKMINYHGVKQCFEKMIVNEVEENFQRMLTY